MRVLRYLKGHVVSWEPLEGIEKCLKRRVFGEMKEMD
jgi:hypothetical protein